jgi:hypothetical protein
MIRQLLKDERYSATVAARDLGMCRQTLEKKLDKPWTFEVKTVFLLSKMVHIKPEILFKKILEVTPVANGK